MKIRSIITKFLKLPWRKKLLHLEAFFFQLSIGLLLKIIPFRYIPKLFATPSKITIHDSRLTAHGSRLTTHISPLTIKISLLEDVKNAIWSVSRFSPWKNKCLVQSLSARKMLSSRGIMSQLSLGVLKGESTKTVAHAWIKAGDFEVVGKDGDYCELFLF